MRKHFWSEAREIAVPAGIAAFALGCVYVRSSFTRYLINDDYQTLYTAWLKSQGKIPGKDFFLASYYLLPDLLAPLFKLDAGLWFPLYAARLLFVLLIGGIAVLLYRICVRLFSPITGLLAPVVLLSTAALLQRGLDLRPDLLTTYLWLAIIDLLLSQRVLTSRVGSVIGVLLGIALINRFKAGLIAPGIALVAITAAWREKTGVRPRLLTVATWAGAALLGLTLALLLYVGWILITDDIHQFIRTNVSVIGGMSQFAEVSQGTLGETLTESFRADGLFWVAFGIGVWLRATHARRYDLGTNIVAGVLLMTAVLSIALNPAYYVYNLVTLQSLLAPFAAYPLAIVFERLKQHETNRSHVRIAGVVLAVAPALV